MTKWMLMCQDETNAPIVVGPFTNYETAEKAMRDAEDRGWVVHAIAPLTGVREFAKSR
jgi:hypothetical protein